MDVLHVHVVCIFIGHTTWTIPCFNFHGSALTVELHQYMLHYNQFFFFCGDIIINSTEINFIASLYNQANYLKSCGAIGETPPEMLKGSNQITEEETNGVRSVFLHLCLLKSAYDIFIF